MKNIKEMSALNQSDWDSVCTNCGVCCLISCQRKYYAPVYYTKIACNDLDLKTRKCKCFHTGRAKGENPICHKFDIRDILVGRSMPDSCAYAERLLGAALFKADIKWDEIIHEKDAGLIHGKKINSQTRKIVSEKRLSESVLWNYRFNSGQLSAGEIVQYLDFIENNKKNLTKNSMLVKTR